MSGFEFGRELYRDTTLSFGQRLKRRWIYMLASLFMAVCGTISWVFIPPYDEERIFLSAIFFGCTVLSALYGIYRASKTKPVEIVIYERGMTLAQDKMTQRVDFRDIIDIDRVAGDTVLTRRNATNIALPKHPKTIEELQTAYETYLAHGVHSGTPDRDGFVMKRHDGKQARKKARLRSYVILGIALLLIGGRFAATEYVDANPVIIREDGFAIHMHERGIISQISSILTGGYEVRFDDIASIELLPYSARELEDMIDDLRVPVLRQSRYGNRVVYAGYVGNYRLHIFLGTSASSTIWITRYEGSPILLSFRQDGHSSNAGRTEWLYSRLIAAWGGVSATSALSIDMENSLYLTAREATEIVDAYLHGHMTSEEADGALRQLRSHFPEGVAIVDATDEERLVYHYITRIRTALRTDEPDDVLEFHNRLRELIDRP